MPNYLTDEPIDGRRLLENVADPASGAHVVFEGVVRNHHRGRSVESITYEAYRSMAEKEIGRIVAELQREYPAVTIAVIHRLGTLEVGEVSIAIACASAHRAEAFDACRAAIDRIKLTVPIWKRERGPEGEEWVGWQSQ